MTVPVKGQGRGMGGFTLVELIMVVAVLGIVSAIAVPAARTYYEKCCVMAAATEITNMIKEAKQNTLCDNRYYGVGFDPVQGKVSLLADRGPDGTWNTGDEQVIRSFRLADKGGVRFGHGAYGPLDGLAAAPDGISFQANNTLVCNPELTGNGGTVYLISGGGVAMAIGMNSEDLGYKLWRWDGSKWVRL